MIRGKKLVAIIPVRKGSKGIPGKNLYPLAGITLLERSIFQAKKTSFIDEIIVSTDCKRMHEIAKKYGVASEGLRPAKLATDTASTIDVVLHELEINKHEDVYVVLLQVSSPLRTVNHIEKLCKSFEEGEGDSIVTLTPFDSPHPVKVQKIEDGFVRSYMGKESMVARQMLPSVFYLNGAGYLTSDENLKKNKSFFSSKTIPFLMSENESVNLDNKQDLMFLEFLIEKGEVKVENYE